MANNTLLSDLHISVDKYSVCVKLICKGRTEIGVTSQKTALVLGDKNGILIQATYYEALNGSNAISMVEGVCYEIKNFKVIHEDSFTRLTRNRYHIKLSNSSLITQIHPIPYATYYDFGSYKIIRRGLSHPRYSIDLYGALVGVGDIEYFVNEINGANPLIMNGRIQFSLINIQFTQIKCVAYGTIAQQLHDFWNSINANVVLCVLQFWRIDWGQGGFNNVTNIDGISKILFDPEDVQEIHDFRKRIPTTDY